MIDKKIDSAQKGDVAIFRCGGASVILKILHCCGKVDFHFNGNSFSTNNHGFRFGSENPSDFDIINISSKPFEWKDLKAGMAFEYKEDYAYFVYFNSDGYKCFSTKGHSCPQVLTTISEFSRAPRKDYLSADISGNIKCQR